MDIQLRYDLSRRNSFRMRVSCGCWVDYSSVKELEALQFDKFPQPIIHIGEGSNLLFTGDFPGTVLHSSIDFIKYVDLGLDEVPVMVGAGVNWDNFVANTCRNGLWGAENLSFIPGQVGSAAVQNIGAYGVEVADIISGVVCYDLLERKKVKFTVAECGYGYRHSIFKEEANKGRYIITSVLFRLSRKARPRLEYKGLREAVGESEVLSPEMVRRAVIAVRRQKLPDPLEIGSAGSFFKNPIISSEQFSRISPDGSAPHYKLEDGSVKVPAAFLIESCGFKGRSVGGAAVYSKHSLVIVNSSGSATPQDILELERQIISAVQERYGITLHPEVEHI